jgi:phosphomannomutase/phosphoglucomutase
MVTASHNPAPYNGFKLVLGPNPVSEEDIAEIADLVAAKTRVIGQGSITKKSMIDDYIEYTVSKAQNGKIKVVIDAGNGATSLVAPKLFRKLGYDIEELYCQPDGSFPNRPPNPAVAENLRALREKVIAAKAQLGIAFDGDGDRVAFIDENGIPVTNDAIMVLFARHYLKEQVGTIIYDAKCSMVVPEEVTKAGGHPVMARAGHTFSKKAFLREKALFAGEISGHFFFSELGYDDGMFGGLRIAEFVKEHGSLAALVSDMPQYISTPDLRVPYHGTDKAAILEEVARVLEAYKPNLIDGVRIEFDDGWGMIRSSVTEPLFTLRFEARSKERLQKISNILLAALPPGIRLAVQKQLSNL